MTEPDALRQPVYAGEGYKPFGEFTVEEVQARARELHAASGFGPTARVSGVARAWSELAAAMSSAGARTVAELGPEAVHDFARRGWVTPPGLL